MKTYQHLGAYSGLVELIAQNRPLFPRARPGKKTQQRVLESLAFSPPSNSPQQVQIKRRWKKDGIYGEELSWSVGYGPRTQAWLLRPDNQSAPLPGIIALHDHGGFKFYGKEKIADDLYSTPSVIKSFRKCCYEGQAFANSLAREGFAVLVHDVFLWGSRKFDMASIPDWDRWGGQKILKISSRKTKLSQKIDRFNAIAAFHEHTVAKYCNLLGITLPGIISYEDRIAVQYLMSRKDICNGRIGCIGLSGGGLRSALLQATCSQIQAAVIVGLMSTYQELLDHNIICHTWMLFPPDWGRYVDWPDLAACRAPSPLLVQYDLEDVLFTGKGMKAAHQRLRQHYCSVGASKNYKGEFYPGPHKFDLKMQKSAFSWLKAQLQ